MTRSKVTLGTVLFIVSMLWMYQHLLHGIRDEQRDIEVREFEVKVAIPMATPPPVVTFQEVRSLPEQAPPVPQDVPVVPPQTNLTNTEPFNSNRFVSLIELHNPRHRTIQPVYRFKGKGEHQSLFATPCVSQWKSAGVFWQTRYNFESLVLAAERDFAWTIGEFANSHRDTCTWKAAQLWNLTILQSYFGDTWLPSHRVAHIPVVEPLCDHCDCFQASNANKAAWEAIVTTLLPAPWIVDIVNAVTPKEPFVCLHPRIENDFQKAFQSTLNYRTWPEILTALHRYFRSDAWKSLSAANGGVKTLYVAGGVSADLAASLVHKDHFFEVLHSKDSAIGMLSGNLLTQAKLGAPSTLIDSFVCQRSVLHIGTSSSIWDEWVYGVRRLHDPPLPSLRYAGHDKGSVLLPFKGNNDGRFFLSEEERAQYVRDVS